MLRWKKQVGALMLGAIGVAGAMIAPPVAAAQDTDRGNITIVVPYSAGGGNDMFARLIATEMRKSLGKTIIVENRPGASGNIGTAAVARAAPDGNTLVYAASTISINGWVYKNLGFVAKRDLKPVTITLSMPFVLVVHPSLPVRDAKSFIAFTRSHPGELTFSSGGAGSATRFAMEAFKVKAHIDLRHIPYRGAAPALISVVSGETQAAFLVPPLVVPHLRNGKLRALGISSEERISILPALAPLDEAGAPGFRAAQWHAIFVPAATAPETVGQLYTAVSAALNTADLMKHITAAGATKLGMDPAKSEAFFLDEIRYWGDIVKRAKLDS